MASEYARQLAAQAWCKPTTSDKVLDPELAKVFAEIIDSVKHDDLKVIEEGYYIISNLFRGNWYEQFDRWKKAAMCHRANYIEKLNESKGNVNC